MKRANAKNIICTLAMSAALTSGFLSMPGLAETEDTVHLGKSEVSKEKVIELLSPKQDGVLKTRGLRLHPADESPAQPAARALSLEVYFEFNSDVLTPNAREQLAPVGEALVSNELANVGFTLEGHTDATGDETYNLQLSERRAQSVKNYFVENYALTPDRVDALGKGESELIEGANPNSGVNRRVTIIAE